MVFICKTYFDLSTAYIYVDCQRYILVYTCTIVQLYIVISLVETIWYVCAHSEGRAEQWSYNEQLAKGTSQGNKHQQQ